MNPRIFVSYHHSPVGKELESLLSRLQFSDELGDLRTGSHFRVHAHPWLIEDDPDHFCAHLRIQPLSPAANEIMPCNVLLVGDIPVLPPGPTNARGDVFFRRLPRGNYEAELIDVAVAPAQGAPLDNLPADLAAATPALAAAAAHFAPTDSDDFAPLRLRLPDRPIEVVLSRASDGRALLTFEARDPALAGSGHTWSLGGESGWFELERSDDRWIAEARLEMYASDAREIIHRLAVRSDNDSKTEAPAEGQPDNVIQVDFRISYLSAEEHEKRFSLVAAAASSVDTPATGEEERRLQHSDPESGLSIEALLQPTQDGNTAVTLRSEDRAIAAAGIAYSIGSLSGTMRFGRKMTECYFQAKATLPLPWSEARVAPVTFEICPKPE